VKTPGTVAGEARSARVWAVTGLVFTWPPAKRYSPLYVVFSVLKIAGQGLHQGRAVAGGQGVGNGLTG